MIFSGLWLISNCDSNVFNIDIQIRFFFSFRFLVILICRVSTVLAGLEALVRQIELGIILTLLKLLSLTVQLLPEVLFLLCRHTFSIKFRSEQRAITMSWIFELKVHLWLLQCTSDFHIQFFDSIALLEHLGRRELARRCDLRNFRVLEAYNNVLRLEVSVDDLAHAVHIVEAQQTLASQLPGKRDRHSLIIIALDNFQKVDAEDFENHHKMFAIRAMVDE